MTAYSQLEAHFAALHALEGAQSVLHWDMQVMMPPGSAAVRGEQLAALAGVIHTRLTDPTLGDWLAAAEAESLNEWQRANWREMRHHYMHATAVPGALVEALTRTTTRSEQIWREAKAQKDYSLFAPVFAEVLALTREAAQAKAAALKLSPYDALLDQYDPGLRTDFIDPLFAALTRDLPPLVETVIAAQHPAVPLDAAIPIHKQEALGRRLMTALGFDFGQGRIDTSAHPFCGGTPGDIRLTTRYREDAFTESLYGVLHETGHALYEMGLPPAWRSQPVGRARGMSLHESQSLLIEMQLGLAQEFLSFLLPLLRSELGVAGAAWEEENVIRHLCHVERSFIRVTADELTYPLHVILRYELEQDLLSGALEAPDLPDAWNAKMRDYLGITPPDAAQGCLQDIHWPGGSIGYFPTYTLGAMIAAQLFDAARRALPDLPQQIARGQFAPLTGWLQTNVHAHGSRYTTEELVRKATGQPLNPAIYKAHLERRYKV